MPRKTTLNEAELFREAEPSPDLPRSEATDATTSPHVGKSQSIPRPVEVDHPPPRPEAGPPALPLPTDSIVRPLEPGVMRLSSTFGQPTADSSTVIPSPPALQPVFTLPPRNSHRTLVIGGAVVAASIAAAVMLSHGSSPPPPTRGNIQILSVPQGASVRFDGQPVAQTTPVTVPDIDRNRPHDVEVSLPGYQTKRQRVEIGEDVIVVLQRDVGTLDVRSEPAGAELYVDGKPAGTTPTTVRDLPLGSDVSLELRLRGYRAYREVLQWNGQRALARQITLKRSR